MKKHSTEVFNMLLAEWNWDNALTVSREEGWGEGLEQAARNALAKGYTPEQVRDITGLDPEALERLRNR